MNNHASSAGQSRVMVVDDEPLVSLAVALALGDDIVERFDCAMPALSRAREAAFDFVISDFKMPGMNGIEFYDALVRERPELACRFVLMTASFLDADAEALLRRRGVRVLQKPFDLRQLGPLVHSH
jgi:CheY-like chemotaxis protein